MATVDRAIRLTFDVYRWSEGYYCEVAELSGVYGDGAEIEDAVLECAQLAAQRLNEDLKR